MQPARHESIRIMLHTMLKSVDSAALREEACTYLYGVSTFASVLALKRGYDRELASIAGLLHHYYYYKTGIADFPGVNSAEAVRPLIRDMGSFSPEELHTILHAICLHSDQEHVHGPYDEIVKDAVVLQRYFQHSARLVSGEDMPRLQRVLNELTLPSGQPAIEIKPDVQAVGGNPDKRALLADIAEQLASQDIIGVPGNRSYREICQYWPDADIYSVLKGSWCAAFVYHCCRIAGILLPIRYPNSACRFAGVGAWLEWSQLPENEFFYRDGQDGFTPQRGDIVIYEKLLSEHAHDHIGVVLACDAGEILVAEGNRDNQDYSCVFRRDRAACILGYVRIDNRYVYHFAGEYDPLGLQKKKINPFSG
ncbi:CHAP domain-containing protein [Paenibacillus sp. DLE-14]|uniref:CHAP domain-containing protein n=2 Tax=Paenibacillus lignilyticus TaxID=1172615 RepID=A0ABS5CC88_9BACL|nr:CHAP domain-containing protein [Paenibacillus lignilyticus]